MLSDLRHAFRSLGKSRGFTTIALVSIALGISANTAVFSLANGILLRSLPVPEPDELRLILWSQPAAPSQTESSRAEQIRDYVPLMAFPQIQQAAATSADVVGFSAATSINVRTESAAFSSQGWAVSENFFSALRMRFLAGRSPDQSKESELASTGIVISHRWWKNHFQESTDVLGKTVFINESAFTVTGVLPEEFQGVYEGDTAEFFVSFSAIKHIEPDLPARVTTQRPVGLIARLKPGATNAALEISIQQVLQNETSWRPPGEVRVIIQPGRSGIDMIRSTYRQPLLFLTGAVTVLMLVVCTNLAGLSLVKTVSSERDHATRAALGASPWQLMRGALIENLLLAAGGAALGLLTTYLARDYLSKLAAGTSEGLRNDLSIDSRVLAFTILLTLLTTILSGLLPGLRAARVDPVVGLKSGGTTGSRGVPVIRLLVTGQIALSIVLVTLTALYAQTFVNLLRIDPGFPMEKLLVFRLKARATTPAEILNFHSRVHESLKYLPGADAITTTNFKPLLGVGVPQVGAVLPMSGERGTRVSRYVVGTDFFNTLEIPFLAGRPLNETDRHAVVVNEAFAHELSLGTDLVGQTLRLKGDSRLWTIVGLCRDTRLVTVREPAGPAVFVSTKELPQQSLYYTLRATQTPSSLADAARRAVASVDADVAIAGLATQNEVRLKNLRRENLVIQLATALTVAAIFLSSIGLYGLLAFGVARRTQEFGIRLALGARTVDIIWPILREASLICSAGLIVGLVIALLSARLIASRLYGVTAHDPATLAGVAALLFIIAIGATWLPARRATKVNPIEALRAE